MDKNIMICVVCVVLSICITIASIYFQRVGILWWFIAPALLAVEGK